MNYREVSRKLLNLDCQELPRKGNSRDLKTGTLRAVVKQLGLDWQSFLDA